MDGLFAVFLAMALAAAFLALLATAAPRLKGQVGEWMVHFQLTRALPASHYTVLRDVTVNADRGSSQIDHVVISPYGVFVIETKHYSGWIFGGERDARWTRVRYRSKHSFQNPLRQNHGHLRALQEVLGLEASQLISLVVFTGSAEFKTDMPPNVTQLGGMVPFIQVRTEERLGFEAAERCATLLREVREPPGLQTQIAHIRSVRETQGQRFGARPALAGLLVIAAMTLVAGVLVDNLARYPGQYPDPAPDARKAAAASPFAATSGAPRVDLPGTVPPRPPVRPTVKDEPTKPPAIMKTPAIADESDQASTRDKRLAWEASLMCAYSLEIHRCSCIEPQGRKVDMPFGDCRALADRRAMGRR